jgi:hypothetical protein
VVSRLDKFGIPLAGPSSTRPDEPPDLLGLPWLGRRAGAFIAGITFLPLPIGPGSGLTWTPPSMSAQWLARQGSQGGALVHLEVREVAAREPAPNYRLARLMADAGFASHKAFARAVRRISEEP